MFGIGSSSYLEFLFQFQYIVIGRFYYKRNPNQLEEPIPQRPKKTILEKPKNPGKNQKKQSWKKNTKTKKTKKTHTQSHKNKKKSGSLPEIQRSRLHPETSGIFFFVLSVLFFLFQDWFFGFSRIVFGFSRIGFIGFCRIVFWCLGNWFFQLFRISFIVESPNSYIG